MMQKQKREKGKKACSANVHPNYRKQPTYLLNLQYYELCSPLSLSSFSTCFSSPHTSLSLLAFFLTHSPFLFQFSTSNLLVSPSSPSSLSLHDFPCSHTPYCSLLFLISSVSPDILLSIKPLFTPPSRSLPPLPSSPTIIHLFSCPRYVKKRILPGAHPPTHPHNYSKQKVFLHNAMSRKTTWFKLCCCFSCIKPICLK